MTTEAALNEMNRQIGGLIASVDGLRRDVSMSDTKGEVSRANVHRRLDDQVIQMAEQRLVTSRLHDRLEAIDDTLDKSIVPTIERVRSWEQRGIGALAIVGIASASIGGFVVYYWDAIVAKLTRIG